MVERLFRAWVGDPWCGLRAIRRGALDRLGLRSAGMELALEMVVRAAELGLEIRELPIELRPRGGESKRAPLRDGLRSTAFLLSARATAARRSRG